MPITKQLVKEVSMTYKNCKLPSYRQMRKSKIPTDFELNPDFLNKSQFDLTQPERTPRVVFLAQCITGDHLISFQTEYLSKYLHKYMRKAFLAFYLVNSNISSEYEEEPV